MLRRDMAGSWLEERTGPPGLWRAAVRSASAAQLDRFARPLGRRDAPQRKLRVLRQPRPGTQYFVDGDVFERVIAPRR